MREFLLTYWLYVAVIAQLTICLLTGDTLPSTISAITGILFILGVSKGIRLAFLLGITSAVTAIIVNLSNNIYITVIYLALCAIPLQIYGLFKISCNNFKPKTLTYKNKLLSTLTVIILYTVCYIINLKYPTKYFILSTNALCFGLLANYYTSNNYRQQYIAWIVQNISNLLIWICIVIETNTGYGQLFSMIIFLINTLVSKYNYDKFINKGENNE